MTPDADADADADAILVLTELLKWELLVREREKAATAPQ